MKTLTLVFACLVMSTNAYSQAGAGNGTDQVATVFAQAKEGNIAVLDSFEVEDITLLSLDNEYKHWLKDEVDEKSRLSWVKLYQKRIEFDFETSCDDGSDICYDGSDPMHPKVCIDKGRNREITLEQAQQKLYHEVGHAAHERHHLFLDEFGAQMAKLDPLHPLDRRHRWKSVPVEYDGYSFLALTSTEHRQWRSQNSYQSIMNKRADLICELYGHKEAGPFLVDLTGGPEAAGYFWEVSNLSRPADEMELGKFTFHSRHNSLQVWKILYFTSLKCVVVEGSE